jgi:hypothetical protein
MLFTSRSKATADEKKRDERKIDKRMVLQIEKKKKGTEGIRDRVKKGIKRIRGMG